MRWLRKVRFGLVLKEMQKAECEGQLTARPPAQVILLDWFGSPAWLKDVLHPTLFQVEPFKS